MMNGSKNPDGATFDLRRTTAKKVVGNRKLAKRVVKILLVSVVCLQGLANRDGARVFLTLRRRQCHSSFEDNPLSADGAARLTPDTLARYRSAPEFWRDYYSTSHGYVSNRYPIQWFCSTCSAIVLRAWSGSSWATGANCRWP
jgi:hypothetical protein